METGDLVQETLVRVLRRLGELDSSDPQKLQNYLTSAIRNRVKDESTSGFSGRGDERRSG